MLNFFDMIADFFSSVWQMIINIVTGLVNALLIVASSLAVPVGLLPYVPSFIAASITIVLGVGVVKLIIGWGNN